MLVVVSLNILQILHALGSLNLYYQTEHEQSIKF